VKAVIEEAKIDKVKAETEIEENQSTIVLTYSSFTYNHCFVGSVFSPLLYLFFFIFSFLGNPIAQILNDLSKCNLKG